MASKKVQVEVKQGAGFRTECRSGKHLVVIDQSPPAGGDEGPSPLEIQLMALGGCIAAIGRIIAGQRRLPLRGMEISLEGELDPARLLGKETKERAGFSAITARVKIDADIPPSEQAKFLHDIDERCPVSDNLQNATPINIVLAQ